VLGALDAARAASGSRTRHSSRGTLLDMLRALEAVHLPCAESRFRVPTRMSPSTRIPR
jgi:hypothetical protein